ncbi:MAG: hypothetical protein PVI06_20125 [Desulfobacterales bacterium]|jgi:quercetin dioxygenase-like cupin family protein
MHRTDLEVIRWSGDQKPDETSLRKMLDAEGLHPYVWSNNPGDVYGAHSHGYHKVICVVSGSITFGLPGSGDKVALHAGDRLELPPRVAHDAVVGPQGVVCLEARREFDFQSRM